MDSMFKRICDNIRTFHGRSGNLIFTDMKVLVSLEYELRRATGVPCAVIPILEQHILMDACRVTMAVREELKRTYRHVLQRYVTFMHNFFRYTADGSPFEYQERPEEERTKIVLSVCVTGDRECPERQGDFGEEALLYPPSAHCGAEYAGGL